MHRLVDLFGSQKLLDVSMLGLVSCFIRNFCHSFERQNCRSEFKRPMMYAICKKSYARITNSFLERRKLEVFSHFPHEFMRSHRVDRVRCVVIYVKLWFRGTCGVASRNQNLVAANVNRNEINWRIVQVKILNNTHCCWEGERASRSDGITPTGKWLFAATNNDRWSVNYHAKIAPMSF